MAIFVCEKKMDNLTRDLTAALDAIPLIDPHSHIEPLAAASKSLDDILGYHYYTELAHSAGMPQTCLAKDFPKRDRCREIIRSMSRYDNCEQSRWFDDIAKSFLGFKGDRVTEKDADSLFDAAEKISESTDEKVNVWDSSAELRYMVLPERPAGTDDWTEDQLASIVTRDCMIGTAVPQDPGHG